MEARLTLLLLRQRGVALKTWAMARALTIEQRLRARGPGETTGRAVETVLIAAAGNGKVAVVAGDGGAAMMVAASLESSLPSATLVSAAARLTMPSARTTGSGCWGPCPWPRPA